MSSTRRKDTIRYAGIVTGIPFMTIAGYYVGLIVGRALGPPWTDSLPVIGGLFFFLLVLIEFLLLETRQKKSRKIPLSPEKMNVDLSDYQPGMQVRSTFKLDWDKDYSNEEE
ncbi:MAG: hypothetical protein ACXAEU_13125 [Candidatus Hodarchaeales archaeon]|jgi:hypothetical protein